MKEIVKLRIIVDFFRRRLTVLGLARKYHLTVKQVEDVLRWR